MQIQDSNPDLKTIFDQHMADLAEERKGSEAIYSLIVDGRAHIETEAHAAAVVRAMAEIHDERERVEDQHTARLKRIDAKERSLRYLFETALAEWTARNLTGKKKSIILPDGTVGMRTSAAKTVTESDATLREWAKVELPNAFNYDRAPLLMESVKEWEAKHGKAAPGRIQIDESETFYVKFPRNGKEEDHE